MNLAETIKHCEEISDECENMLDNPQLARWLKELVSLKKRTVEKMARFIELTAQLDNAPVFVNVDNIFLVWANDSRGGAEILSTAGDDGYVHVKESLKEVMKLINPDAGS